MFYILHLLLKHALDGSEDYFLAECFSTSVWLWTQHKEDIEYIKGELCQAKKFSNGRTGVKLVFKIHNFFP